MDLETKKKELEARLKTMVDASAKEVLTTELATVNAKLAALESKITTQGYVGRDDAERKEVSTKFSVVKAAIGYSTQNWVGCEFERDVLATRKKAAADPNTFGGTVAGGYLVPLEIYGPMVEELLAQSVLMAAGAVHQEIGGSSFTLSIPSIITGAVPNMASEGGTVTDSRLDFNRLTPTAKKAIAIIGANSEILRSRTLPDGFEQVVRRSLVRQLAAKVDQQGLSGTGSNGQVTGLRGKSLSNVTMSSSPVTGFVTANALISLIATVATNNALTGKLAWIMHPTAWAAIYKLRDTAGQPLITPFNGVGAVSTGGMLYGYPIYLSSQVMSTATVYFGNVADMTLWDWGIYVDVSTEAGFLNDQVYIRGLQHFDWTLAHTESFVSGHSLNVS